MDYYRKLHNCNEFSKIGTQLNQIKMREPTWDFTTKMATSQII